MNKGHFLELKQQFVPNLKKFYQALQGLDRYTQNNSSSHGYRQHRGITTCLIQYISLSLHLSHRHNKKTLECYCLFRVVGLAAECGRWEDTHHEGERPLPWHHSDQSGEQHLEEKTHAVRGWWGVHDNKERHLFMGQIMKSWHPGFYFCTFSSFARIVVIT